jgi:hypothetical protein
MKKERLLIFSIQIMIGLLLSWYIFNIDKYDKLVFYYSGILLLTIIISGYIIFFGENVEQLISKLKFQNVSKKEIMKSVLRGHSPKTRIFVILVVTIMFVCSYVYLIPDVKSPNVSFSIDGYWFFGDHGRLIVNYSVVNDGLRPVWIFYPSRYQNIIVNFTDNNGQPIIDDASIGFSSSRVKLHYGESIDGSIKFDYVSDDLYLYYREHYDYLHQRYWTYNTTPPYELTLTYDSITVQTPVYRPIWRGTLSDYVIIDYPFLR